MDASEFKEFIFGMLFLKRLSDEFDRKREQLRQRNFVHLKDQPELVKELLEDKTFINADREYAEGKAQNKLRPEDIEKIDFVFTHKREIPQYSRLVDKAEIVDTHDYNLNIRRYVDNTPDPEPEDVQAHLIGGIPEAEVSARATDFARFGIKPNTLFEPGRTGYLVFRTGNAVPGSAEHQLGL